MKRIYMAVMLVACFALGFSAQAATALDDPVAIVKETFDRYRKPVYEEEEIEMKTSSGREYEIKRFSHYDKDLDDKIMVKFQGNESGVAILILFEGDDVTHLYRKGRRIRRISIQAEQYVLETDLTQEDLQRIFREDTDKYHYRILSTDAKGWTIEALPSKSLDTGYSKRILHIDRKNVLLKTEYFVTQKKLGEAKFVLSKTITNHDIEYHPDGIWRPNRTVVENHLEDSRTEVIVKEGRLYEEIKEAAFTKSFLKSDRSNP